MPHRTGTPELIPYATPAATSTIPIIDLSDSFSPDIGRRRAVAWEAHKACRDTGFFYVANHGIPSEILDRQLAWARRFFALPLEAKRALTMSNATGFCGYEPLQMQTLDQGSPPDLKEGFQFNREAGTEAAARGTNQWPSALPDFRPQMLAYQEWTLALGRHLMRVVALSLDLAEDYFDAALAEPSCSVRLLHYPPHPAGAAFNQLGAGAHTDWGSITMLLQDDCGGLEIQNTNGDWIRATPVPGTLVINLGDMMQRWTNDIYHSTLHRVFNATPGRDRYSVASFFNVNRSYRIECLPTCRPETGEPLYPPCTAAEHTKEMFERTYGRAR
jgi:isopenicillin N synthase-like dioxygenase